MLQLLLRKWKSEGHKVTNRVQHWFVLHTILMTHLQILIFSKATRMLNILENFIRREGFACFASASLGTPLSLRFLLDAGTTFAAWTAARR